jgi:hypothetical protein
MARQLETRGLRPEGEADETSRSPQAVDKINKLPEYQPPQ